MFKSFSFLVLNAALFGSGVFAATGSINSELSQLSKCAAVSGSKFANGTAIVMYVLTCNVMFILCPYLLIP